MEFLALLKIIVSKIQDGNNTYIISLYKNRLLEYKKYNINSAKKYGNRKFINLVHSYIHYVMKITEIKIRYEFIYHINMEINFYIIRTYINCLLEYIICMYINHLLEYKKYSINSAKKYGNGKFINSVCLCIHYVMKIQR